MPDKIDRNAPIDAAIDAFFGVTDTKPNASTDDWREPYRQSMRDAMKAFLAGVQGQMHAYLAHAAAEVSATMANLPPETKARIQSEYDAIMAKARPAPTLAAGE